MRLDLFRSIRDLDLGWPEVKVTNWPFRITKYMSRSALREKDDGCKISVLFQIAKKLLMKNYREELSRETEHWPDLEGQRLTQIGQLAHHWIWNVLVYPLVFVAKLYHTQERDGAGVGWHPPRLVKKEMLARVNLYVKYECNSSVRTNSCLSQELHLFHSPFSILHSPFSITYHRISSSLAEPHMCPVPCNSSTRPHSGHYFSRHHRYHH